MAAIAAAVSGLAFLALIRPIAPMAYGGVLLLSFALLVGAAVGIRTACRQWARDEHAVPRARELLVGANVLWSTGCLAFLPVELATVGASYLFVLSGAALAAATALRMFGNGPRTLAALVLAPAMFLAGPVVGPLVQLASKSILAAVGMGAGLLAVGAPLTLPVAVELDSRTRSEER